MFLTGLPLSAVPAAEQPPGLEIRWEGSRASVEFDGELFSSDSLHGPWRHVATAASPALIELTNQNQFFLAGDPITNSLFASTWPAELWVAGPLQAHFDLAFAGMPDGIFPPVREKPYFDATLALPGLSLPVSLRVRGNSSLQECPFPKLKFKVSSANRAGTPFADAREVKIGTHCAEGGRGGIGRLREESATFRETLVYELLARMGFVAPRVRRARIVYVDTTPPTNANATVGWQLRREALLQEDIEVVAERLGARVLTEQETREIPGGTFDPQLSTDLQLFHAMIGNWDYALGWDGRGVWNTEVLELPQGSGKLVPVAGDFDLASIVTGVVRPAAPRDYHPELEDVEREARYQVEQIQTRMGAARFEAGRERFRLQRAALEALAAGARLDAAGRLNAVRHLTAFYQALEPLGLKAPAAPGKTATEPSVAAHPEK